jgi:hypothetical protein
MLGLEKRVPVHLTAEQRGELSRPGHGGYGLARTQTGARILLLGNQSTGQKRTGKEVAAALMCSPTTVANARRRSNRGGLQTTLYDRPRPGVKRKVAGNIEVISTMVASSQPPEGQAC